MSTTESCYNSAKIDVSKALGVRVHGRFAALKTFNESEVIFRNESTGFTLEVNDILKNAIPQKDQWHFDPGCLKKNVYREDGSQFQVHVRTSDIRMPFENLPLKLQQSLYEGYKECIKNGTESRGLGSVRLSKWSRVHPTGLPDYAPRDETDGAIYKRYQSARRQKVILELYPRTNDHPVPSDKTESDDAVNPLTPSSTTAPASDDAVSSDSPGPHDFAGKGSIKTKDMPVASNESAP